jgi:hypothetical protein
MGGSSEDLESILRRDRAIHKELTDDMARLAKVLKNNVTAFGDILRKDQQVIYHTVMINMITYVLC